MNKFILSILLSVGMVGMVNAFDKDTYSTYELSVGSAQLWKGAGYIKAVQLSTTTNAHAYGNTWGIVYDSVTIPRANANSMGSDNKVMLPLLFTSTPTVSNLSNGFMEWPDPGLFISSGAFVYKNTESSGEAHKMIIYFKR